MIGDLHRRPSHPIHRVPSQRSSTSLPPGHPGWRPHRRHVQTREDSPFRGLLLGVALVVAIFWAPLIWFARWLAGG